MSAIEEIISGLQAVIDKIEESATAANGVGSEIDTTIGALSSIGATNAVGALQAAKDATEEGASQAVASIEKFKEAITQAQAAIDGG